MNLSQAYELIMLALCCWREARGESIATKYAQAWSVRNRVNNPGWWGHDWVSVILKPEQYSSFNAGDPNAVKFPTADFQDWMDCLKVASDVYAGKASDPTSGATSYYDISIAPPKWTASMVMTVRSGRLVFYKLPAEITSPEIEDSMSA